MNLAKKILNFLHLEIAEFIICFTILFIGISNIVPITNNGREFSKIILPENIKFIFIILLIILYILYGLEWMTHHAWLRIAYFAILPIVLLVMLIEPDKRISIENINIAIFLASILYIFIIIFCIIYDVKKCVEKNKKF